MTQGTGKKTHLKTSDKMLVITKLGEICGQHPDFTTKRAQYAPGWTDLRVADSLRDLIPQINQGHVATLRREEIGEVYARGAPKSKAEPQPGLFDDATVAVWPYIKKLEAQVADLIELVRLQEKRGDEQEKRIDALVQANGQTATQLSRVMRATVMILSWIKTEWSIDLMKGIAKPVAKPTPPEVKDPFEGWET